jgi:hypothetical protein
LAIDVKDERLSYLSDPMRQAKMREHLQTTGSRFIIRAENPPHRFSAINRQAGNGGTKKFSANPFWFCAGNPHPLK